ncbi:DUF6503 family protein [Mesoflavibacter sp.]|uniref:DUF6503 family protein n=1 Tax=Mesoflavibacter sp. TaxID=1930902 RepID=UPI003518CF70
MKNFLLLITLAVFLFNCKEQTKKETEITTDYKKEELDVTTSIYPETLTKIFDAHGGIDLWNQMKSLEFTMPKPNGNEVTLTNLKTREALITHPDFVIGHDGAKTWYVNNKEGEYKGYDPKYYYNLMFYFYAMPFVFGDDGINISDAEPLTFEGKTYPGIKFTYENGVGETPEDQYIVYYNPETYVMEWLGYTVNFIPGIDTTEFHFRRYSKWQDVNGILLPAEMVRYKYKNNLPTEPMGTTQFIDVKLTKQAVPKATFKAPEIATIVE